MNSKLTEVDRIHFFICESDFNHGDQVQIQIRNFSAGEIEKRTLPLDNGLAGASLWMGGRGYQDSRTVIIPEGTAIVLATLCFENRLEKTVPADAMLQFRIRDVFTGKDVFRTMPLGGELPPRTSVKALHIPIGELKGGYYHVLADLLVDGVSVLGTRKGSDDLYITRPGESMTMSMLSLRTGMASWVRDRLYDGFFCSTAIALPHSYDPYDTSKEAYRVFLEHFVMQSYKHTEGYEAGLTGIAIAAEAFRLSGDKVRQAFAESLIASACTAMLRMQDPNGGVVTISDELTDNGILEGPRSSPRGQYNNNQIGEWMRGLNYAALYYNSIPEKAKECKRLNDACRKAGDFLVAHSLMESDGIPGVIRHFMQGLNSDGTIENKTYRQKGRQCDVYQPRALAGLSYTAYTLLRCGESVPDSWWNAMDATVQWMAKKMKDDGWFDWQCSDVVEGGCHTFLGNIYAGEGLFGVYAASLLAGRSEPAAAARLAAHKAYRYLTDSCAPKGNRWSPPREFWVGPYLYWLFQEWNSLAETDEIFQNWLNIMDNKWTVELKWQDFQRIPPFNCGRASSNGMLTISILGYLGLRQMNEQGTPWMWFTSPTKQ